MVILSRQSAKAKSWFNFKLKEKRKKFVMIRVEEYWHRFPRKTVGAPWQHLRSGCTGL